MANQCESFWESIIRLVLRILEVEPVVALVLAVLIVSFPFVPVVFWYINASKNRSANERKNLMDYKIKSKMLDVQGNK